MKHSFGIIFGLSILAILDSLLGFLFPADFTYQGLSLIWHFFFIGIMVLVHDKPWKTRILIGMLSGILIDFLFTGSFPYCFVVYGAFGFLIGFFEPWMYRTKPAFVIYMLFCFLVDWIPYIIQTLSGVLQIGFWQWLYHMELLSTIANAFEVTLIMYVDLVMVRFFYMQKQRAARENKRKAAQQPDAA